MDVHFVVLVDDDDVAAFETIDEALAWVECQWPTPRTWRLDWSMSIMMRNSWRDITIEECCCEGDDHAEISGFHVL